MLGLREIALSEARDIVQHKSSNTRRVTTMQWGQACISGLAPILLVDVAPYGNE